MKRRISVVSALIGLFLALSGCGKSDSGAGQNSGTPSSPSGSGNSGSQAIPTTQAAAEQLAAINTLLKKQDLVLAVGDLTNGGPPGFALELLQVSENSFTGQVWLDDKPPHVYSANAFVQKDESTGAARVVLVLTPPGQAANVQTGAMQLKLAVSGDAKNLEISTRLQANGSGAISTLLLDSDPKLHKAIVERFNAEVARLAGIQKPVADVLKDFTILNGQVQSANANEPQGDSETVMLAQESSQSFVWHGEEKSTSKKTGIAEAFPVVALVAVSQDKPFLVIRGPARQTVLSLGGDGKFTGAWGGGQNAKPMSAEFAITTALDAKGRDDLFAAQKAQLMQIASDSPYLGLATDPLSSASPPYPITLAITASADGSVAGKVFYPMTSIVTNVNGKVVDTLLGPRINLQNSDAAVMQNATQNSTRAVTQTSGTQSSTQKSPDFGALAVSGGWTLGISAGSDGLRKLSGICAKDNSQSIIELNQFTDAAKADFKKSLTAALSSGLQFKARLPDLASALDTVVEFKLDLDSGAVAGRLISGGAHFGLAPGDTYAGELKEEDGWMELILTPHDPAATQAMEMRTTIYLSPSQGMIYFNGANFSTGPAASTEASGRFDGYQVKP